MNNHSYWSREVAKKAAATLRKRFGKNYFKRQGAKGGAAGKSLNPLARMIPADLQGRDPMIVNVRYVYLW